MKLASKFKDLSLMTVDVEVSLPKFVDFEDAFMTSGGMTLGELKMKVRANNRKYANYVKRPSVWLGNKRAVLVEDVRMARAEELFSVFGGMGVKGKYEDVSYVFDSRGVMDFYRTLRGCHTWESVGELLDVFYVGGSVPRPNGLDFFKGNETQVVNVIVDFMNKRYSQLEESNPILTLSFTGLEGDAYDDYSLEELREMLGTDNSDSLQRWEENTRGRVMADTKAMVFDSFNRQFPFPNKDKVVEEVFEHLWKSANDVDGVVRNVVILKNLLKSLRLLYKGYEMAFNLAYVQFEKSLESE